MRLCLGQMSAEDREYLWIGRTRILIEKCQHERRSSIRAVARGTKWNQAVARVADGQLERTIFAHGLSSRARPS
jgi:hypothetical protein